MERILDHVASLIAIEDLQRNTRPVRPTSLLSLSLLFAPGVLFVAALWLLKDIAPRYSWAHDLSRYP